MLEIVLDCGCLDGMSPPNFKSLQGYYVVVQQRFIIHVSRIASENQ